MSDLRSKRNCSNKIYRFQLLEFISCCASRDNDLSSAWKLEKNWTLIFIHLLLVLVEYLTFETNWNNEHCIFWNHCKNDNWNQRIKYFMPGTNWGKRYKSCHAEMHKFLCSSNFFCTVCFKIYTYTIFRWSKFYYFDKKSIVDFEWNFQLSVVGKLCSLQRNRWTIVYIILWKTAKNGKTVNLQMK